jgi:hypothetical protein
VTDLDSITNCGKLREILGDSGRGMNESLSLPVASGQVVGKVIIYLNAYSDKYR